MFRKFRPRWKLSFGSLEYIFLDNFIRNNFFWDLRPFGLTWPPIESLFSDVSMNTSLSNNLGGGGGEEDTSFMGPNCPTVLRCKVTFSRGARKSLISGFLCALYSDSGTRHRPLRVCLFSPVL